MPSFFDKDIKGVPLMRVDNPTSKPIRFLRLSNASNETGIKTVTANIYGHQ